MVGPNPLEYLPQRRSSSKRSACDRCRRHKLRCPREHDSACMRCIRARTECVTSCAKPTGRPRAETPRLNTPRLTDSVSLGQWTGENTSLGAELLADDRSLSGFTDFFVNEDVLVDTSGLFDPIQPTNSLPNHSLELPPDSSPSTLVLDGRTQPLDTDEEQQRPRLHPESRDQSPPASVVAGSSDPSLLLSSLNLSLSRQLFLVKSSPWDFSIVSNTTCSGGINETHEATSRKSTEPNPLRDVLRSTSEFLAIVQLCTVPEDQRSTQSDLELSSTPTPLALACSSPGSPHCITTALALLSCYLQIIAIYDAMLGRVYASLCTMPDMSVSGLQTVPGLRLAGFPLQHGSLQIKILIQVIEHQCEMIEKSLGLPVKFRVSGRQDVYTGLLSGRKASALLMAVMGLMDTRGAGETEVGLGLGYVVFLQESIKRVQQLL